MSKSTGRICLCLLVILSLTMNAQGADPKWADAEWRNVLDAVRQVETGGKPNEGIGVVGDNGDALGPYQIHKGCWQDACEADASLKNKTYQDCLTDKAYSEKVFKAYIRRYLPKGGSPTDAARIWNGGPKGHTKSATLGYMKKFMKFYKAKGEL